PGKGLSSLAGLPGLLPAPSSLESVQQHVVRHRASFTASDLIQNGAAFDPALPQALATAGPGSDPRVTLTTNTDPYQPATSQAAYATYRFTLSGYAGSGQAQSVGTLWETDDAPTTYFVGLSDWQRD